MAVRNTDMDAFLAMAIASDTDECIEWKWADNAVGYGIRYAKGRSPKLATHIVMEAVGRPRPGDLYCCHSCNNPPCINPKHLRWDTNSGNQLDRRKAGNDCAGERHHFARLTEVEARRIKFGGEQISVLAEELSVSISHVRNIRWGHRWSHIEENKNG